MSAIVPPSEETRSSSGEPASGADVASATDRIETGLLYALFGLLAAYIWTNPQRIGWDAANYLHCGDEILRGRIPFAEIVDVNPPLVQFLHVVPALLARVARTPALAFNLYSLALAAASTLVVGWLLWRPELGFSPGRRFATLFAYGFANHLAWVEGDFGQREHFILLATFPALLVRWMRHEGFRVERGPAIAIGLAMATAVAIKPHYLLPLMLFEAILLVRHRDWKRVIGVELLGVPAVALGYAALFLFYPTMRSAYFGRYLPLFAAGYRVYDCSVRDLFVLTEVWVALGVVASMLARRAAPTDSRLARPLATWLAGAILVYLFQHKGWRYQILPAFALAPVALTQIVVLGRRTLIALAVAVLGLTVYWYPQYKGKPSQLEYRYASLKSAVRSRVRPGEAMIMLSTGALGPFPMQVQLGIRPGSRFAWLPLLAMFYPQGTAHGCTYRKWGEGLAAERQLLEDIAADIHTRRPALIVAETGNVQAMRIGCSPSQWVEESGLVERAMTDYAELHAPPGFRFWGLRREPATRTSSPNSGD